MLNYPVVPTPAELKSAAALERRRLLEEARRCRVFNPRTRAFGIDKEALDKQIAEKKRAEEEWKRLDAAFNEQKKREDEAMILLEKQREQQRRTFTEEINKYRLCHQRIEDRREYDLNDPDYLKKLKPMRSGDEDPGITISSIQRFEGEDLAKPQRLKIQAEQKHAWYQQQSRERKQADEMRCKAELEYQKAVVARDKRAMQLDSLERELRAKMDQASEQFNRGLAFETRARRTAEEQQDQEDKMAHMYNVITSDMMTENRDVGFNNFGPPSILSTMYRGLSAKQKADLKLDQEKQVREKKLAELAEKQKDAEWVKMMTNMAHAAQAQENEIELQRRRLRELMKVENQELGAIQKDRKAGIEASYVSIPTCDYFNQFGTSTR